jgi:hypothetical protein
VRETHDQWWSILLKGKEEPTIQTPACVILHAVLSVTLVGFFGLLFLQSMCVTGRLLR